MMKYIFLGLSLPFDTPEVRQSSEQFLLALLGHNCVVDHRYLREREGRIPLLYDSGVAYAPPDQSGNAARISPAAMERVKRLLRKEGAEPHRIESVLQLLNGVEEFLDVESLYKRGRGDCNELVPVRVAELWRAGIMAQPYLTKTRIPGGGIAYHALVLWPDGTSEDPSLILGMGGPARADERLEEIRKNKERWDNHMAAARELIESRGADPRFLGQQIDRLGLLPKGGVFRTGGQPVSVFSKTAVGGGVRLRPAPRGWQRARGVPRAA